MSQERLIELAILSIELLEELEYKNLICNFAYKNVRIIYFN